MKRITLIDFPWIIHHSIHYASSKEEAIEGVNQNLKKVYRNTKLKDKGYTMLLCQNSESYFRSKILPSYKSKKSTKSDEIKEYYQAIVAHFTNNILSLEGLEAFDVLFLATEILSAKNEVLIVSANNDLHQIKNAKFVQTNGEEILTSNQLNERILLGKSSDSIAKSLPRSKGKKAIEKAVPDYETLSLETLSKRVGEAIADFNQEQFDMNKKLFLYSRKTLSTYLNIQELIDQIEKYS